MRGWAIFLGGFNAAMTLVWTAHWSAYGAVDFFGFGCTLVGLATGILLLCLSRPVSSSNKKIEEDMRVGE
jgi:hypothetical protein